ncbi:hypothetical protein N8I77_010300 [Diaporthe amygdali]|uniref:2EXR domain-containing protein n=1 Tax=Phomopsis amygdali TaxID=1214568 RepID=A0AAD9W1P1_PHOAM|nr:hypothetical protein N8I77_010300 [Diaporthe amygdali]
MCPSSGINRGRNEQPESSSNDKAGLLASSPIKLGVQPKTAMVPLQDDRKVFPSIKLERQTSQPKLDMPSSLSLKNQPKGTTDAPRRPPMRIMYFNTIPAELRIKIYKMTWEPRLVTITRRWLAGEDDLHRWKEHAEAVGQMVDNFFEEGDVTTVTTGSAQMPVTLWINAESRSETLRHYQIAFSRPKNGDSHVYFNFGIDKLHIPLHGSLVRFISKEELAKVKELILPRRINASLRPMGGYRKLEHLKTSIVDLDIKLRQLDEAGLSQSLEPDNPNIFENAELRRLAEKMQQEIAQVHRIPQMLSSLCPSLEKVHLRSATTCRYWPSLRSSLHSSRLGGERCPVCSWDSRCASKLGIPVQREQLASYNAHVEELGRDREMRLGQVTVTWRAFDESEASKTGVKDGIMDTVADWNHFASDMKCRLLDCYGGLILFEI